MALLLLLLILYSIYAILDYTKEYNIKLLYVVFLKHWNIYCFSLSKGNLYLVTELCQDGWFRYRKGYLLNIGLDSSKNLLIV